MKPHRLQNELVIPGQVEYWPAGTRVAQLSKILIANWNLFGKETAFILNRSRQSSREWNHLRIIMHQVYHDGSATTDHEIIRRDAKEVSEVSESHRSVGPKGEVRIGVAGGLGDICLISLWWIQMKNTLGKEKWLWEKTVYHITVTIFWHKSKPLDGNFDCGSSAKARG